MHESPRTRRLRNDLAALERLAAESSVFQFKASGNPPIQYAITFSGKGLSRDRGKIRVIHSHQVEVKLGSSYPRTIPEIRWLTPIYHPNISEIGMVCLGGYGTHWVPSVQLDELCTMLWDMVRYHNYDIRSPYNRDAALWVANQTSILFPTDGRAIRDLRVALGRVESNGHAGAAAEAGADRKDRSRSSADRSPVARVRQFIERYGKVFEPEAQPEAPRAETLAACEVSRAVATSAPSEKPTAAEESAPPPQAPAASAGPPASSGAPEDDLIILDDDAPAVVPPPVVHAGEDILFIE